MNQHARHNERRYNIWLVAMGIAGGVSGWIVHGMQNGFVVWALPLFCILATVLTLNGDNVIESFMILAFLGGMVVLLCNTDTVEMISVGTMTGIYVALCVAKLGFAFGKRGAYGNTPFS